MTYEKAHTKYEGYINQTELAPTLNVYRAEDFANFHEAVARGGERRVILAQHTASGENVAIKTHRRRKLKQMVLTKYPQYFKSTIKYRRLNEKEIAQERDVYHTSEEEISQMQQIDWSETFKNPEFKKRHNALVLKAVNRDLELSQISSMVPVPRGVYVTKTGLVGEVYTAYSGNMAQNISNPSASKPLTQEQEIYYEQEYKKLRDSFGNNAADELMPNNIIVTGDGPTDIVFAELPEPDPI